MAVTRDRRRGGPILLALALFAAMVAAFASAAGAVHDTGAFELDGNAVRTTSDDWDEVCYSARIEAGVTPAQATATCTASTASTADENAWANDGALNATIFTGGGSKDPLPIEGWAWKDQAGGLPDKDNLLHAFAARYSLPGDEDDLADPNDTVCESGVFDTCELLFFGSDRFDNSGDAHQAFWFLQDEVGLGTNKIGGGTGFTGTHIEGDVLAVSEFSNGGSTATIKVWEWDPTCTQNAPGCADENLRILAESNAANCATAADGDGFCGIVNGTDGTTAPWAYTDKSGNSTYLGGEFFEAGLNLSTLGLADQCFSTVVAESRASTSSDATLKDFVIAPLGSCEAELVTTPSDNGGTAIPADGISIGTGSVQVKDSAVLTVNGTASWSGTLDFYLCGPIATGTCSSGGLKIGGSTAIDQDTVQPVLSSAATVTEAGRYCWRGEFTSSTDGLDDAKDDTVGECFVVNPVTPNLSTTAVDAAGSPSTSVTLGSAIYDTASLTGTANKPGTGGGGTNGSINPTTPGAAAAGTITFKLYGPGIGNCNNLAAGFAATHPSGIVVNVNGDSPPAYGGAGSTPPVSFTPTAVGDYYWKATYSGDSPNTNSQTHNSDCSDANEKVTVNPIQPGIATNQRFVPNDKATITVASGGGDLAGNVVFKLYVDDLTCTGDAEGNADWTSAPFDITSGQGTGLSRTVLSNNTNYYETSSTFRWVVEYTSTNNNHANVTSPCGEEISSITINNDALP